MHLIRLIPLSLLLLSCAASGPLVEVSISGAADVDFLKVHATLDDRPTAEMDKVLTRRLDVFQISLSPGTRGRLKVWVGTPESQCYKIGGQAEIDIAEDRLYALTIQLGPPTETPCSIHVDPVGPGAGKVFSTPPGISCPGQCEANFALGTQVLLHAQPDAPWYFGNWAGACSGRDVCSLTVKNTPHSVQANFITAPVCNAGNWCWEHPRPWGGDFLSLAGRARNDVWAVGISGTAFHWDGVVWKQYSTGTTQELTATWWSPQSPIGYAVGANRTLLTWTGVAWTPVALNVPLSANMRLSAIWGSAEDDLWIVGDAGAAIRWNGTAWTKMDTGTSKGLRAIGGTDPKHVWTIGDAGLILFYDGARWTEQPSGTMSVLRALRVNSANDLWAVGDDGVILHGDGTRWKPAESKVTIGLSAIGGSGPDDLWIVGGMPTKSGAPQESVVLRWRPGTNRWERILISEQYRLRGVWSSPGGTRWAVGEGGTILTGDAADEAWVPLERSARHRLLGIWGSGPNDIWTVGLAGLILHWDGVNWNEVKSGTDRGLYFVSGHAASGAVWAVGDGVALRWRDGAWRKTATPESIKVLHGVWASADGGAWSVGGDAQGKGIILSWDPRTERWQTAMKGDDSYLIGVWGSQPDDVWAIGAGGTTLHWRGSRWESVQAGTDQTLFAIWGSDRDNVWAVGDGGTVVRWNGAAWRVISTGVKTDFNGIWGSGANDVWIVGDGGTILRGYSDSVNVLPIGTSTSIHSIWGHGPNDVWVVGSASAIFRYRP